MRKKLILLSLLPLSLFAQSITEKAGVQLNNVTPKTITLVNENGYLYSKNELEYLSRGELTNGRVVEVSKSRNKKNADPIVALKDFNDQLQAEGIKLIVMPVPPKLAVYPVSGIAIGEAAENLQAFEQELQAQGIEVLDITPELIANKDKMVYCKTDSHWSPNGMTIAAQMLAKRLNLQGEGAYEAKNETIKIVGDLQKSLDKESKVVEDVELRTIKGEVFSESSPVLVIGDSHTLIFSTGKDMLAENSGFCEQLAFELKMPIDRIGVKGSASTPVRINLYRKAAKDPQWLLNKKFVILLFTCREFTESTNGWAKVPIKKK